jgi:hypothetical protein
MIMREQGIYCLPNGRELVVLRTGEGSVTLRALNCEQFEMGEFLVNEAGRLVCHGKLTAWDISNLSDTGCTSMDIVGPLEDRLPQSEING